MTGIPLVPLPLFGRESVVFRANGGAGIRSRIRRG